MIYRKRITEDTKIVEPNSSVHRLLSENIKRAVYKYYAEQMTRLGKTIKTAVPHFDIFVDHTVDTPQLIIEDNTQKKRVCVRIIGWRTSAKTEDRREVGSTVRTYDMDVAGFDVSNPKKPQELWGEQKALVAGSRESWDVQLNYYPIDTQRIVDGIERTMGTKLPVHVPHCLF